MTKKTIEVPVEMIERGDIDALRDLLPQDYFGRWANHPEHGRVLVTTQYPDRAGEIPCSTGRIIAGEPDIYYLPMSELEFDPTELVTAEDFANAPAGTIITHPHRSCHEKSGAFWWLEGEGVYNEELEKMGPWQVLRWGYGDE